MIAAAEIAAYLESKSIQFRITAPPGGGDVAVHVPYETSEAKHHLVVRTVATVSIIQFTVLKVAALTADASRRLDAYAYLEDLNGLLLAGAFAVNKDDGEVRYVYSLPGSLVTAANFPDLYEDLVPKILQSCDEVCREIRTPAAPPAGPAAS
jgi:hypothetical protein